MDRSLDISWKYRYPYRIATPTKPRVAHYQRVGEQWIVTVGPGRTAVAGGRTLVKARAAIVSVLAEQSGTYPYNVVLDDDVLLPESAAGAIARARGARDAALVATATAKAALSDAARVLIDLDLSTRDAGYLLGISHARVQQIASPDAARTEESS